MKKLKAGSGNPPSDPNEERAHVGTVVVLSVRWTPLFGQPRRGNKL
jgi:hypothetical protein